MGWSYTQSLNAHTGPRQYLDALFTHSRDGHSMRIVRSALVRMTTYYAAAEVITPTKQDIVAIVCLVKYNPRDREGWILGYKDMDETMGPYEANCPGAVLDLLTPISDDNARQWRERCRTNLAARRLIALKPTPQPGQIIRLAEPLRFRGGVERQTLHVVAHPKSKRTVLFKDDAGGLFRISDIKSRSYTLLHADGTEVPIATPEHRLTPQEHQ